jgi:hypothetical protein
MPDRISRYRTARLLMHMPSAEGRRAHWDLMAIDVAKGIPHSQVIGRGVIEGLSTRPSQDETVEAMIEALASLLAGTSPA